MEKISLNDIPSVHTRTAIIYSMGEQFDEWYEYIAERWAVVGVSDRDPSLKRKAEKCGQSFINVKDLSDAICDDIVITSIRFDQEIKKELHRDYGVLEDKLLLREQWLRTFFKASYGEMNPERTFFLMQRPRHQTNGIWSHLFALIEEMMRIDLDAVEPYIDLQTYPNQYLESNEVGKKNAFEFWFKQPCSVTLDEIKKSKNIILGYDWGGYLGKFPEGFDVPGMLILWKKYFSFNDEALSLIEKEKKFLKREGNGRALGVLYRGSDYKALHWKYHSIQPDLNEFLKLTADYSCRYNCDNIYLSTEDADAAEAFKKRFGKKISMTDQLRFSNTGTAQLSELSFGRQHERRIRGNEYITTIALLSECDCLLTGIQSGAAMAYLMNQGRYEHAQFLWRGQYTGDEKTE